MIDLQTILTYLTLISIPVGVLYHILTLNNTRKNQQLQLETRQAQLFMGIYGTDLQRLNIKAQNGVIDMGFDGIDEFEEKYGKENNPEAYLDWSYHLNYMEGIGVLVREGLVDVKLVTLLSGGLIKLGWEKFFPIIKEYRIQYDWPRWAIEYEYLYNEVMKYAKEHPELQLNP